MASYGTSAAEDEAMDELAKALEQFNWKDSVVDRAKRCLFSEDPAENIRGALQLKAMLCIGRNEVYEIAQEVIDAGVIAKLVEFLSIDQRDLQWPAAFCLTNVAAGSDAQTAVVVGANAVPPLVSLLHSPDPQLRRQAVFCLANIAGSIPEHRTMLARTDRYFEGLFTAVELSPEPKLVELVCWNLRNICVLGGPSFEDIKPGIAFLLRNMAQNRWCSTPWSSCARFAMEAISHAAKSKEEREFLLENNLLQLLLTLIPRSVMQLPLFQWSLECLVHVLQNSTSYTRGLVASSSVPLSIFSALTYVSTSNAEDNTVRDVGITCLACLCAPDEDSSDAAHSSVAKLVHITDGKILDIAMSPFLPSTFCDNAVMFSRSYRECAGYIFVRVLSLATVEKSLLWRFISTPEIPVLLFEVLDFAVEQQKARERGEEIGSNVYLPDLAQHIIRAAVTCALQLLEEGAEMQRTGLLPDNPVAKAFADCGALDRLQSAFQGIGALPSECIVEVSKLARLLSVQPVG